MPENFNLSFIISTKNRLPFLKILFDHLLRNLSSDEELVVVDGNSTDGSKEFLLELFENGTIHQLIIEPDRNQAHGWNKAMLIARGILIKKIIDDDVFCFNAIRACKDYMLRNKGVDVVISNDLTSALIAPETLSKNSRLAQFEKWRTGLIPSFTFSDVHMLIRRSSLSYIGLYHTGYINMDWEYGLRISHLQANISYFTGYNALNVAHPETVTSLSNRKVIQEQGDKGRLFYDYPGDGYEISYWSKIKIFIGKLIYKIRSSKKVGISVSIIRKDLNEIYDNYYELIDQLNITEAGKFVKKG
jgi:glycosyltransferase involved in cell wall biosynthesis